MGLQDRSRSPAAAGGAYGEDRDRTAAPPGKEAGISFSVIGNARADEQSVASSAVSPVHRTFGDGKPSVVPSGSLIGIGFPNSAATFFLDVENDVRLTQIFGSRGVLAAPFLDSFFHRVALDFGPLVFVVFQPPRGFHEPALRRHRLAEPSTDLSGGEGHQATSASSQRLRLLVRCVVCTPLCRFRRFAWQLRLCRRTAMTESIRGGPPLPSRCLRCGSLARLRSVFRARPTPG